MNVRIISVILVLALASLACGFDIKVPEQKEPGPKVTEEITVPDTGSLETRLTISFGAGSLKLSPGANDDLVNGTAVYNIPELKPEIVSGNTSVEIKQGDVENLLGYKNVTNKWDLELGDMPIELDINAGAYEGRYELGGLSLIGLTVQDGAADVELSFSRPNKSEMSILRYETGASSVTLTGLANANFSTLMFTGGAGDYKLDFGGKLEDDTTVNIEAGAGSVQLIIPKDVNAKVTVESALTSINHSSSWAQNGNAYTQQADGPTLTIIVKMAAGELTITD